MAPLSPKSRKKARRRRMNPGDRDKRGLGAFYLLPPPLITLILSFSSYMDLRRIKCVYPIVRYRQSLSKTAFNIYRQAQKTNTVAHIFITMGFAASDPTTPTRQEVSMAKKDPVAILAANAQLRPCCHHIATGETDAKFSDDVASQSCTLNAECPYNVPFHNQHRLGTSIEGLEERIKCTTLPPPFVPMPLENQPIPVFNSADLIRVSYCAICGNVPYYSSGCLQWFAIKRSLLVTPMFLNSKATLATIVMASLRQGVHRYMDPKFTPQDLARILLPVLQPQVVFRLIQRFMAVYKRRQNYKGDWVGGIGIFESFIWSNFSSSVDFDSECAVCPGCVACPGVHKDDRPLHEVLNLGEKDTIGGIVSEWIEKYKDVADPKHFLTQGSKRTDFQNYAWSMRRYIRSIDNNQ